MSREILTHALNAFAKDDEQNPFTKFRNETKRTEKTFKSPSRERGRDREIQKERVKAAPSSCDR